MLQIRNLRKSFGDLQVLKSINLDVNKGDVVAILGPSGSGKTTMLRCLNFLERPDTGVIKVNGETMWDAADPATQRESEIRKKRLHFGLVFQNFNLFPQYTALQNVMLAGELLAKERPDYKANKKAIHAELEQQAQELLAQMGLSARAGHYPHQLSGGMLQRIMIGIAMSMEPSLLIADEPTTAIDAITQFDILNEFAAIKQMHKTAMLFISHDLNAVSRIADKIVVLNQGMVVDQGDFHHIIHHAADPYTRLLIEKRTDVMRKYRRALEGGECSHAQAG